MSIQRILARVDGTDGDAAVLAIAHEAATAFQAHVDVVHIRFDLRDLPLMTGYGIVEDLAALADTLERTAQESRNRAQAHFDTWRQASGLPLATERPQTPSATASWIEIEEREADAMARLGRLADLVVVAQPTQANALSSQTALETSMFETRRPVLMVPPGSAAGRLFHRPVIAWNGSREASLAVGLALPILAKAQDGVGIFSADEEKPTGSVDDLARYLGWHGIATDAIGPQEPDARIGANLLQVLASRGAGLLVMGAFTHGRVHQLLLGGVTSHVLKHAGVPVLLAH